MKGDYNRYICDLSWGKLVGVNNSQFTQLAYGDAIDLGKKHLSPTNHVYLSAVLKLSIFYYEHLDKKKKAYEMAKEAYNDATSLMEEIDDKDYKESYPIMKIIQENLKCWAKKIT